MDGLVSFETQSDIREMINASITKKTLMLYINHSNFLKGLREDVLVRKPQELVVEEGDNGEGPCQGPTSSTASISSVVVLVEEENNVHSDSDDTSVDSELIDSDFVIQEGDDDLFVKT
jgi:hypothetical protein